MDCPTSLAGPRRVFVTHQVDTPMDTGASSHSDSDEPTDSEGSGATIQPQGRRPTEPPRSRPEPVHARSLGAKGIQPRMVDQK
eukprot:3366-Prorocentrum_lima.AAC.1